MSKFDEVSKILKKYSNKLELKLKSVVGVKTGALKSSISSDDKNNQILLSFLDYGEYINPWIKKTQSYNVPGYIPIVDKTLDEMLDELEDAVGRDFLKLIPNQITININ